MNKTLDLSALDLKATADDFAPALIPAGEGTAKIVDGELKETKNGKQFFNLKFQVVPSGQNKARVHFQPLWLTTEGAKKMARSFLGEVSYLVQGYALGYEFEQLIDKKFPVKIEIENGGDYDDKNRIRPLLSSDQKRNLRAHLSGKLAAAPKVVPVEEFTSQEDDVF